MDSIAIDIIVPVYKSVALTARCLQSIAQNIQELAAFDARLIVINDSPGEPAVQALLQGFASEHRYARVLENDVNQGFVKTVNRGLAQSVRDRRDVILINADTQTYPGTLKHLVATAHAAAQIAFVSPRSNNASLCSLPHLESIVSSEPDDAYRHWQRLSRTMPAHHFVPTAVGFYLYIKRVVLANLGLLDCGFGLGYEEENDLILRANKVGYRAALANHAYAWHAGAASFSLTQLDLKSHRENNLRVMSERHAEFLPLLRRYESSPHFRAERLLGSGLPATGKRLSIVFDLVALGCDYNGTNEFSVGVLSGLCRKHGMAFDLAVICSANAFEFHRLDTYSGLRRIEPAPVTQERFAIAVRFGQPFDVATISAFEALAPICVYSMLDTIADDCGYLSVTQPLADLWGHVARHANGICYISQFSQDSFESRFPQALKVPRYTRILPTHLAEYRKETISSDTRHVLIVGNHFAHKASLATANILKIAMPHIQFALLGKETEVSANVSSYKAGMLSQQQVRQLYSQARVIVLPSYMEGFGFGLVHSLAAGKVIVARDIPATREILATYKSVTGVLLYQDETELVGTVEAALDMTGSQVDDSEAHGWEQWADGFAQFCSSLPAQDDLFPRLVERTRSSDLLRSAARANETAPNADARRFARRSMKELMALDGAEFVQAAYAAIFDRDPDTDGLEHYTAELHSGISKFAIVRRLRESDEGRIKNLPLAGFKRALITRRVLRR